MSLGLCCPPPQLECEAVAQLFVREPQVTAAGPGVFSLPVPRASKTSLCFIPDPLRDPGSAGYLGVS